MCVHDSACAFLAIGLRCYVHVCVVCMSVLHFCVVAIGLSVCENACGRGGPVSVIS